MSRPTRKSVAAPESFAAILDRAGESRFARLRPAVAPKLWRDAVGARIADRARPISLSSGVLLLRVATSVWAHELSLLADVVCERLRERGVVARELRFHVGAVPAVDRPPERRVARVVPAADEIPPALAQAVSQIADPLLRAAIARAAAANLAWQSLVAPPTLAEGRISEAQRGARAPRSAERGSAPPDQTSPACRAEGPDSRAVPPNRRR
jgi:predicted nucleic acid-binding Zn ribbon protein